MILEFENKGNPAIDPKEENQQWKALCDFCQKEAKNASKELAEVLKTDVNSKASVLTSNSLKSDNI